MLRSLRPWLLLALLLAPAAASAQRAPVGPLHGPVPVASVRDGDTLVVMSNVGPRTVRLIGVDAPETGQPRPGAAALGAMATAFLVDQLPPDGLVWLELDLGLEDVYGRLLAYVYVADPDGDWLLGEVPARQLNLALAEAGWAWVMTVPPNARYQDLYQQAVDRAEAEGLGMWSAAGAGAAAAEGPDAGLPDGPIVIWCALYNPDTPNDEGGEWVSLLLRETMDTRGYHLYDAGSGQSFHLPAGEQPAGALRVPNPGQGVWNNGGDTIYLMHGARTVDAWDYSDRLAPEGEVVCRDRR